MPAFWGPEEWEKWRAEGRPCTPDYLIQIAERRGKNLFPLREACRSAASKILALEQELSNERERFNLMYDMFANQLKKKPR